MRAALARRPGVAPTAERRTVWARIWPADLLLFAALLTLTALFGRPFAKLGIPALNLYVTEVAIAAIAALALWRCGLAGALARVRRSLPLLPLVVLWLAGAIAAVRGLEEYGFSRVVHDIGLVEYSILLPLLAVVVDTRAKAETLVRVLSWAGVGATLVFAVVFFVSPYGPLGVDENPGSAVALYMSLLVLAVASRLLHRVPVHRVEIAAAALALVLMSLMVVRSALLALVAALVALAVFAPSGRRLVAAGAAAACLGVSVTGAAALEKVGLGLEIPSAPLPAAEPDFVADDGASAFLGGRVITGDAASGQQARELRRGEVLELPALTGLEEGARYAVVFALKPLTREVTRGRVGDISGRGWSDTTWTAAPVPRWQQFRKTLTATATSERLAFYVDSGAARVRIDAVGVLKGLARRSASSLEPRAPGDDDEARPGIVLAVDETFGPESGTGFSSNARWRLAIWRFMAAETARRPVFGVGFGKPTAFRWHGQLYDARRGDARNPFDVTGPHNSFVNLLYRTGLVGFGALVALVAVALWRLVAMLRRSPGREERAALVALASIFVFASAIAFFNVALEGPYMAIFFWSVLALLLVLPRLLDRQVRMP